MAQRGDELRVTEDGVTLPAEDVLTGRGFVTGKSGSGKSNTASVLVEELLDKDAQLLIIDTDGEYYGLKEEYEVLHLGASDRADAVVGPNDAEEIADLALSEGVPIVLDVSGFLEGDTADRLVYEVSKHLFSQARDVRQPFLLLVEEVHEFVPEQGGLDEVGEMLVRVAKRGRKRGLGLCGLSQRPASVDKDFITQCDWIAWHRLTWANDTRVVDTILGGNYSTDVETLDDGEAFLMADWEQSIQRVQFRRKRTFDAGATPGFGESTTPDLKPIDPEWVERFQIEGSATEADDNADLKSYDETAAADVESDDDSAEADADADAADTDADAEEPDDDPASEEDAATPEATAPNPQTGADPPAPTTGGEAPAEDPRTAVWELGQLVAHLGKVTVRESARGLFRLGLVTGRATDQGLRGVGFRSRWLATQVVDAVAGEEKPSPIAPTSSDVHQPWPSDPEPRAMLDRFVGLVVPIVLAAAAFGAYTML